MTQAPRCSSAGRPGARAAQVLERPRWRAHRLALDDPNDPTADGDALRAHRLACSRLASWRPGALGLQAGELAAAGRDRFDGGGGPERPAKNAKEGSQKIFYFLANRAMLTV